VRALVALAVAAVLSGCAGQERVCTQIAAQPGVSVTVERTIAATVSALRLTVCTAECVTRTVDLAPGSDTVDQGCSGDDPDDSCSASASPNGELVGFVVIDGLAAGPVRVAAEAVDSGRTRSYPEITTTAVLVYPNGPGCSGEAAQAAVRVDRDTLR
jgi:hypothetical protein